MTVVNVKNGELSQQEQEAYIRWATEHYGTQPVSMDIEFDGDFANIHTNLGKHPFEDSSHYGIFGGNPGSL